MIYLQPPGVICAAGHDLAALRDAVFADAPGGVAANASVWPGHELHLGAVRSELPSVEHLPLQQRSRNNALLLAALAQIRDQVDGAIARHGADRIGVVLGTSTSGVGESEAAIAALARDGRLPAGFHVEQQELGSPALMLAELLALSGPRYVVSTACSSGAKALASGARLLKAGLCDAVLVGGVDALCGMTVAGFTALDSVDPARCRPLSATRAGINIGEGAALFVLSGEPSAVRLSGWGESSDAHHISAPEPSGRGALAAMREALQRAGLAPADIGYLNLHGTATPQNDAMESRAVAELFGLGLPCSSTKPLTGHALGAAGAIEAAIAWLTVAGDGRLPVHHFDGQRDAELPPIALVTPGRRLPEAPRHVMSNSFAFGGNNASLVLSHV
ncbi:3-oxoacyl-[acyl-carrier-protein] synthase-1 [Pelomonas saccharophila]|uniref:3-oxoacyl-[acyl-carrier-protein] synthase-1 n=1 Tax=Roseateles saccharophilus TaxID=304 RepID=A0ABU1YNP4_ROSSA|nr:beta-ketoacyl-ACP synthase [Roseateles saccharophilus]MDR7269606.1 3-oxoacyl-[acyl-carrier-protein] synthase-1 [Roseateles saccharophilus]